MLFRSFLNSIDGWVNSDGDSIIEADGEGTDTVISSGSSYTLDDNVENLRLQGDDAVTGIGNDEDNRITGNAHDNILMGGASDDVLDGGDGEDVAEFAGEMSDYRIDFANNTVTDVNAADGDDGTDSFSNIETLRFAGGSEISLSTLEGDEFRVNTHTYHQQQNPHVTALSDGGYVISWNTYAWSYNELGGSAYDIVGQRYDVGGNLVGDEFKINAYISGQQYYPSVAELSGGDLVVTW